MSKNYKKLLAKQQNHRKQEAAKQINFCLKKEDEYDATCD